MASSEWRAGKLYSLLAIRFLISANDDRFDLGKQLDENAVHGAHGLGKRENRAEIERIGAAYAGADLSGAAADDFPGENAVIRARRVDKRRALRAGYAAAAAISVAPSETPFGEGADAFFSSSAARYGPT